MKFRKVFLSLFAGLAITASASAPRYVFYFIGDGMGMGQVMAAQTYNRVAMGNADPLLMMQFPVAGIVETYSASSTVTDSAAAGTALATGHKTKNGMLGVDKDTTAVVSIAETLHNDGWGVALVTSVAPDDATPGAFYAHVPSRGMTYEIGRQAAESGYEFIAGSSWRGAKDRKGKPTDLLDYMRSHDIDLVTSTDAVAGSKKRRVFLNSDHPFSSGNIGCTIDSIPGALTLPAMTEAAITHMERVSPDHFFMMVEGGNIDHLAHGNDGAGVVIEVVNFNEALAKAYEFYLRHPDETLIVVTADHETGGMSVGNKTVGYTSYTQYVPYQTKSKDCLSRAVKKMLADNNNSITWEQYKEFARVNTGLWGKIPVKESQEARLKSLFDKTFNEGADLADEKTLYSSFNALANETAVILNDNMGFGWTTGGHSGNPVPFYAIGNGTEVFGTFMDNTEIAPRLLEICNRK